MGFKGKGYCIVMSNINRYGFEYVCVGRVWGRCMVVVGIG